MIATRPRPARVPVPTVEQAMAAISRYAEELQDVTHQLQAEVSRRKEASDE